MIKKFIFDGVEYRSENDLRQSIFKKKRIAFGKAPAEGVVEFWSKFGVTYVEEQEPIETLKQRKLSAIKQSFLDWRNNQATLISSLGFKADSNERANTDIGGLLIAYENDRDASITFRDADNQFHVLTYGQLKTLQLEIIENGNHAYVQKWKLDARVESAVTKEELDAIQIAFVGKDFSTEVTSDAE